jgi:hypothetical protein
MSTRQLRKIYLLLVFNIPVIIAFSQVADTSTNINNFYIVKPSDSVKLPKNQNYSLSIDTRKSDAFYDSLVKADQKKWSSQLHDMLVVSTHHPENAKYQNGYDRASYFEQYSQKYIRNISIEQIEVFGPSINDTVKRKLSWSKKLGNSLHISTNKSSIRRNLFISENERIDPYLLADNERLLRSKSNLQDARIYIIPINGCKDSVDIRVLTKDVWPLALEYIPYDVEYGKINIWNNNFFGLGHIFSFTGYYDVNRAPKYGYKAQYRIPNIAHTFMNLDLKHEDSWDLKTNRISLSRDYFRPETRLAGGLSYEKTDQFKKNIYTYHDTIDSVKTRYEYTDYWIGYSIPLKRVVDFRLRKSFFIVARTQQYQYLDGLRPQTDTFYLHDYHNRRILLLSSGWVWQGYQSTRLVYGFGDTEDLPYGCMIKFTFGHENDEYSIRLYGAFSIAISKYLTKIGYVSHNLEFGSYYNHNFEQGVLNYKFQYFSPMFGNKRHIFRQFARIQYVQGYDRFNDEYIDIRSNDDIRGLNYSALRGNKRLLLNTELVYYSPHYLYGFRFVYYLFFDGGIINYKHSVLFNNPMYSSVGIGVRIRNERLVFNTIQFRACFFPFSNEVQDMDKQFFNLDGAPKTRYPEFANRIPEVLEY